MPLWDYSTELGMQIASEEFIYWHTVPGLWKIWRVTGLLCEIPFTVYAKVPSPPSLKVKVAVPTGLSTTFAALNGIELNAGPEVR